jgi:hypothetical protein
MKPFALLGMSYLLFYHTTPVTNWNPVKSDQEYTEKEDAVHQAAAQPPQPIIILIPQTPSSLSASQLTPNDGNDEVSPLTTSSISSTSISSSKDDTSLTGENSKDDNDSDGDGVQPL